MSMAEFGGSLLLRFQSYLTNRRQRVTVLGSTSYALLVTSAGPRECLEALSLVPSSSLYTSFLTPLHPSKLQCLLTIQKCLLPLELRTTVNDCKVTSTTSEIGHRYLTPLSTKQNVNPTGHEEA
jgi:hypothetical protein